MINNNPLLSGRLLASNFGWNLLGMALPLLVAVVAIPHLVAGMGTERFGLLSIVWMMIGYFSLFDLGLGRALTKLVAERLGSGRMTDTPDLIVTALVLMGLLGLAAAVLVAALTPWLVTRVLNVPSALHSEARAALWILAASLPFVILSAALIGLLEAHQRFKSISLVRIFLGMVTFLGPLLALHWSTSLAAATAMVAAARLLGTVAYTGQCLRSIPSVHSNGRFRRLHVRPLLSFGGWLSLSNLISPVMTYLDRFVIGTVLTLSAVSYYVVPYDFVTRLSAFPVALVGVLFPAFSTALSGSTTRVGQLFGQAIRIVTIAILPAVGLIVLFAPQGLQLWVGPGFAVESTPVLRWLAVGVFLNSLARIPNALLQSAGRPDLLAKLHLIELPSYAIGLWLLLNSYGILGAAVAWTGRVAADTLLFFWLSMRLFPIVRAACIRAIGLGVASAALLGVFTLLPSSLAKLVVAGIVVASSSVLALWMLRELALWPRASSMGHQRVFSHIKPETPAASASG